MWLNPNDQIKNKIDYILTNHKYVVHDIPALHKFVIGSDHKQARTKNAINTKTDWSFKLAIINKNDLKGKEDL